MKKMITSSALVLSMTAFLVNFCACGNKADQAPAEQPAQEAVEIQEQVTEAVPAEQAPEEIPAEQEDISDEATRGAMTDGQVIELSSEGQFNQLKARGNVVVDFYAVWCGPCKQLSPIIHDLAQDNKHITFVKVNTESFPALSSQFNVKSIPTLVFFRNGQQVKTLKGGQSKGSLQGELNSLFTR